MNLIMVSIPHILSGISIILLVIYGADVMVGGGGAGDGFLPLDAMTRGIGFGMPPIILSFIAFFMSKKPPFKGLGIMLIVTGVLIIIGGAMSAVSAGETENSARMAGEGGSLIIIGVIIVVLGGIKIKKSITR
jgi:purine-cytosine permease-like protein